MISDQDMIRTWTRVPTLSKLERGWPVAHSRKMHGNSAGAH
jgi:hypothetical protein